MDEGSTVPIECLAIDFDKTLIHEDLLTQWVFCLLLRSEMGFKERLRFFFRSAWRGLASMLLARWRRGSELAVRIAHGTFRDIPEAEIFRLITARSKWKGGYLISLNTALLEILRQIIRESGHRFSPGLKIIVTSQGAPSVAVSTFLARPDVAAELSRAGISVDLTSNGSIIANRLEVSAERFTGRLIPPIITKHSRLQLLPANTLLIGDEKDEAAVMVATKSNVRFLNHLKAFSRGALEQKSARTL